MELFIVLLIIAVIVAVCYFCNKASNDKAREEIIERRKNFVSAKSPTARVIVNNGTHLFYIDSERGYFGVDETDKTYDLENIQSVNTYKDCITIIHNNDFLHIGRDPSKYEETVPLDILSVSLIAAVVLPVLKDNLHRKLAEYGVVPNFEYEHDGIIWGCDLNSKIFFSTFGYIRLHPFSDLVSVNVEDLSSNTLYDGNYIINISIKTMFDFNDDIDITFYTRDSKYYDMLTMFKEIKKRGYK